MSEFSRETLLNIIETDHVQCGEASALARMALAAMDSEHHTDDELSNLLWYSQEATCHSDPNYYCEFQRLATPGFIASIIRELQERRKADSEPVAWLLSGGGAKNVVCFDSGNAYADPLREVTPLYRHAHPAPVVQCPFPCGWDNLNKLAIQDAALVARGLVEGELTTEAHRQAAISNNDRLLKVISACRAAMLHAGNSPVTPDGWTGNDKANAALMMLDRIETVDPVDDDRIDGIKRIVRELATAPHDTPALNSVQSVDSVADRWIPVSERMPENDGAYLCWDNRYVTTYAFIFGAWQANQFIAKNITHWMPLPAAPQEVNRE
ncbi:DUF551 domain-containing protein [Klebsiella pneumoniae]